MKTFSYNSFMVELHAFKEVNNLENDLAQQKSQPLAELKEETANGLNQG